MSTKPHAHGQRHGFTVREFKVHMERSGASYTAKIDAVEDARDVVPAAGLRSAVMDLVGDLLVGVAREDTHKEPDGHD
jgi:hypothetical protein